MTRDEWKDYKDFDEISRDMSGLFSEWPTPAEIVAGTTGYLKAENNATGGETAKPQASHLAPTPQPWEQSVQ